MAEDQWYYAQGGQQLGPIGRGELVEQISRGAIQRTDLVWREGMAQWLPAGQVPGLLPTATPPPLPAIDSIPYAQAAGYGGDYVRPPDIGQNAGMRMLLPVGRSGWAIAAGYLGLFSFLFVPAPIAIIVSIVAIKDIKAHPERHGMGRAMFGLVAGILGSVALVMMIAAIIGKR
jgi:hypothetical protein